MKSSDAFTQWLGCFIGKVSGEHLWTPCVFKKRVYHVEEVILVDNQSTRSSTASKVPTQSWLGTAQWGFMEISIPTNQVLGISRVYYNLCKLHVPFVFMCNYNNYTILYMRIYIHPSMMFASECQRSLRIFSAIALVFASSAVKRGHHPYAVGGPKSLGQWAHRPLESRGLHIYTICYNLLTQWCVPPNKFGIPYKTIGLDIGEPLLDSKPLQTTWFSAKMMPHGGGAP